MKTVKIDEHQSNIDENLTKIHENLSKIIENLAKIDENLAKIRMAVEILFRFGGVEGGGLIITRQG